MAFPTAVDSQITDAVVATTTVGPAAAAPHVASASLQQVWAHAMGLQMQNAAARQQQTHLVAEAVLSAGVQALRAPSEPSASEPAPRPRPDKKGKS